MRTVNEVSKLTGVSIRTLQYYDRIGLLKATEHTAAGYRLYDDAALETLQQILLFRELEFPLKDIKRIVESPGYDKDRAMQQQIELLTMKKERLEGPIALARGMTDKGGKHMGFSAFDKTKLEAYAQKAKEAWGGTAAYREFEEKDSARTPQDSKTLGDGLMAIFAEMGTVKTTDPAGEAAQALVKKLQGYITAHYYTCTAPILQSLGEMYAAGGEFTENIDAAGGTGTAVFAHKAIEMYCKEV